MPKLTDTLTKEFDDIGHQQNQKVFDVYNVYRVVLAFILLISFYFKPITSSLGSIDPELFLQATLVYTVFSFIVLFRVFLPSNRTLEVSQFISVILVDIIFLVLISYTCGGVSSGMANLLIVPVASGSLIFRSRLSTFFAAVGAILAIYSELYLYLVIDEGIVFFVQAGLLGLTLFAVSTSLQYLGVRIRQNELLTRRQAENIQSLQEMNDQIIRRMHNGILVVNRSGDILVLNDAAKSFLYGQVKDHNEVALPDILVNQLTAWQQDNHYKAEPFRLNDSARDLQASFTYLNPGSSPDPNILIFIEDYSLLTSRAQQMKLMSLGRLTASIAHEVRNPLGAISHASQLLSESDQIAANDQRLLEIIGTHSDRINRIIENILDLSRNKPDQFDELNLSEWLPQFISKFTSSSSDTVDIQWQVDPSGLTVKFSAGQLEQVMTNLCENGLRYSLKNTGNAHIAIEVDINPENGNPRLCLLDDGKGIPEELMEQIFEPFFTTEQSGTGLGLFICREICDANYASLSYQPDYRNKSTFIISFTSPQGYMT